MQRKLRQNLLVDAVQPLHQPSSHNRPPHYGISRNKCMVHKQ
jgi:hypothetical protein